MAESPLKLTRLPLIVSSMATLTSAAAGPMVKRNAQAALSAYRGPRSTHRAAILLEPQEACGRASAFPLGSPVASARPPPSFPARRALLDEGLYALQRCGLHHVAGHGTVRRFVGACQAEL